MSVPGDALAFGGGVNGKYGSSESWKSTTTLSSSMTVKGTVPIVKDVATGSYDFYQVWYEYADPESGQDFMVCDWAVSQNSAAPVYVSLELVELFDIDVPAETETYYLPQLAWSVMANSPVHHCALEYKVDGMTPIRLNEDAGALVALDSGQTGWATVEMGYDNEAGEWVRNEFANNGGGTFASWEHWDYFTLTSEQKNRIRDFIEEGQDVYVHYRVKVYQDENTLAAVSNEVAARLFAGPAELAVSNTLTADLFSLPYGRSVDGLWQRAEHSSEPGVFYGDFDGNAAGGRVDLTAYEALCLHGIANQRYSLCFNDGEDEEVLLDDCGDCVVMLSGHRDADSCVCLRSIRVAGGGAVAADAFARVSKRLGDGGVTLTGYGAFPEGYEGLAFYDATGVGNDVVEFPLSNPNALVIGGANITGPANMLARSADVMQGLTAVSLSLTDGYDFCYDFSVDCDDVAYSRGGISEESRFVTAVMPFDVSVDGAEGVYEYADCDGESVYFKTPDDGVIDAYLPIVIDVGEATAFTLRGENLRALAPNGEFNIRRAPSTLYNTRYGFVTRRREGVSVSANEEVRAYNVYGYSINSHQFVRVSDTFAISPFRAFFLLPKSVAAGANGQAAPAPAAPRALKIVINDREIDDLTAVDGVSAEP